MKELHAPKQFDSAHRRQYRIYIPIYRRWWFWVIVAALVFGAFYVSDYLEWWGATSDRRLQSAQQEAMWASMQAEGAYWTARYKADTYGGDTPEETLELFIQALESENYELASKYYVPEKQEAALEDLEGAKFLKEYLSVLKEAEGVGEYFEGEPNHYEINYYVDGQQAHYERLILNEYTGKWKLEDF